MRNIYIIITALAAMSSCIRDKDEGGGNYVTVGGSVPSFTLTHAPGSGTVDFPSGFADRPTVIVLFRSSCGDCRREMPKVHAAWAGTNPQKVNFVAVSCGEEAVTVGDWWVSAEGKPSFSPMPYYLDPDMKVFRMFANSYVPRIYLVGSDGKVKYMAVERFDFDAGGLIEMINGLQ